MCWEQKDSPESWKGREPSSGTRGSRGRPRVPDPANGQHLELSPLASPFRAGSTARAWEEGLHKLARAQRVRRTRSPRERLRAREQAEPLEPLTEGRHRPEAPSMRNEHERLICTEQIVPQLKEVALPPAAPEKEPSQLQPQRRSPPSCSPRCQKCGKGRHLRGELGSCPSHAISYF